VQLHVVFRVHPLPLHLPLHLSLPLLSGHRQAARDQAKRRADFGVFRAPAAALAFGRGKRGRRRASRRVRRT
jgi:hypothetical protein